MLDDRIQAIATHYGLDHQLNKALEELGELKSAIREHLDCPSVKSKEHVVEEIADVRIMLDQIVFLMYAEMLEAIYRNYKLGRQVWRKENEDANRAR